MKISLYPAEEIRNVAIQAGSNIVLRRFFEEIRNVAGRRQRGAVSWPRSLLATPEPGQ